MRRQHVLASSMCVALLAFPRAATSQQTAFVQGILDLTAAIEGALGDEGARIGTALDAMSRALAEWDRQIAAFETESRSASQSASFETRVALGTMYAERGRSADALREFDAASRIEPRRANVHVGRGLVLEALGRQADATEAFRAAWNVARKDPVTAYYAFRHVASQRNPQDARDVIEALAGAYRTILKDKERGKASPFVRFTLLDDAAIQGPILPLAPYTQAYERVARGDLNEAVAAFRQAAGADPMLADSATRSPAFLRAVSALAQGRLSDARIALEQSDLVRDSSEAHRILGVIYWAASEHDNSIQQLETAIRLNARDERARLALSRVLTAAGRDADAERVLLETIRAFPDSRRARLWLASIYERTNRFADARQQLEQAVGGAVAGQSRIYGSIGRLASGAADVRAASEAFARAVSASANDAAMHDLLAGSLLQEDRADEAFAEFIAALLIDPGDAAAHAGIGQIHLNAGRHAEAVEALRRAAELAPADIDIQYSLATALTRAGHREEAGKLFAHVEQAQRERIADRRRTMSLDVLKEEAVMRAGERDYSRAVALWEQVIEREPTAANRLGLAATLTGANRIDAAIEQYEKAVTLGAEPVAYLQLADLYAKSGRASDAARARAMFEKVLQGGPAAQGTGR